MSSQVVAKRRKQRFVQRPRSEGIEFVVVENRPANEDVVARAKGMVDPGIVLVKSDGGERCRVKIVA